MRRLGACALLCFAVACSDVGVAPVLPDSGTADLDAGLPSDGGPPIEIDAGEVIDGGIVDAGLDAGVDLDAGSLDAGIADAGFVPCGNGTIDTGEDCDLGQQNGLGLGCSMGCLFDCATDSDCSDQNACDGVETCVGSVVSGQSVFTCQSGELAAPCSPCEAGVCNSIGLCQPSGCGDGCVDPANNEVCDFGEGFNSASSGCSTSCQFNCAGDGDCSDNDICNGYESCGSTSGPNGSLGQACQSGMPPDDGASCGLQAVCMQGSCVSVPSVCGNGVLELNEDCDLGTGTNGTGHGCNSNCHLDCLQDSDCSDGNDCNGLETCMTAIEQGQDVRRCQAATNADRCTVCSNGFCDGNGLCAASTCGDGCVDSATEQCDFGNPNNTTGSGCESDCSFSCALETSSCDDGNFCNGLETCQSNAGPNGAAGQACVAGSSESDGTMCGSSLICVGGMCVSDAMDCGNGQLEMGEDCDLGSALNGTGLGCSTGCRFECSSDAACSDGNACNGNESCVSSTVGNQTVKLCQAGSVAAACSACNGGFCNGLGQCAASTCGDGCLDQVAGEQCDDGNKFRLDGCDGSCKYEVLTRMTSFSIESTTAPSFCSPSTNAFGRQVLTGTALGQINPPLQSDVDAGKLNLLTQLLGLDDLTGNADPNGLKIGVLPADRDPARGAWSGAGALDWWFLANPTTVSNGLPLNLLDGTLSNHNLKAGPNTMAMVLALGGSPATLTMKSAQIAATINTSPAANVPAPPPAQLASGLTVFQTVTASGTGQGLCGNITVESLAQIPIPEALTTGTAACSNSCGGSHSYTYCGADNPVGPGCNSLLDAMVGGCKLLPVLGFCTLPVINATQPDVRSNGTLMLGANNKVPTSQTQGNQDAYSAYFRFNANRAHMTGQKCSSDSDCQTGQTCSSETCQ